jgi:mono/diheme cytochrome c family protein
MTSSLRISRTARASMAAAMLLALTGAAACRQDMHDGPRYKPLAQSDIYPDKQSARPIIEGTVARGFLKDDDAFYTGMLNGAPIEKIPMPLTDAVVARGRERFNIYCSPCHGVAGDGDGMIVKRGYKQPTSYHDPRLRNERAGYFFDVMTHGFGQMPDYAAQVAPKDRWAIVAYIRALQLSQHASVGDLTPAERGRLERGETGPEPQTGESPSGLGEPQAHSPNSPAEGTPKHDAAEGAPKHD